MNEINRAIEQINEQKHNSEDCMIEHDVLEFIEKALEKQIPKKPIYLTKSHRFPRCPICQCEVEDSCREMGFCDNCGQAILWENE